MFAKVTILLRLFFLLPVYIYRLIISPWLKPSCIYTPTCSQYMITAVKRHGIFRGFFMGLLRIGRCHGSFFNGGDDAVPEHFSMQNIFAKYVDFRKRRQS